MLARAILSILFIGYWAEAAQTLTIQEFVDTRITGVTTQHFDQLKVQHVAACEAWLKASPFHRYRSDLSPTSACSKAKFQKDTITKKVHDCWTEVHPVTGQSIEYCGDVNKTEQVGYSGRSTGTRTFQIADTTDRIEEELLSDSFVGDKAKERAWADYGVTCADWLKTQQTNFGNKLFFAGCRGAEKDSIAFSAKDGISFYASRAVVIFEK